MNQPLGSNLPNGESLSLYLCYTTNGPAEFEISMGFRIVVSTGVEVSGERAMGLQGFEIVQNGILVQTLAFCLSTLVATQ